MNPLNGWPTKHHADKAPDFIRPITVNAKFLVRCQTCGYAADSAATTAALARDDVARTHEPTHTTFTVDAY